MSQPFSGMPNPESPRPEIPRPFKRRSQPAVFQDAIEKAFRRARDGMRPLLQSARRNGREAYYQTRLQAQNLWYRGKRNPRAVGLIAGAMVLVIGGGAYALSASSTGDSLCPPQAKGSRFLLLMDPVPTPAARSQLTIHYDVCGLPSGTPYSAKVRLAQQRTSSKKGAPKPKAMVVTFKDKVDGPATRRHQDVKIGALKPGAYMLEFSVVDAQGRERKKQQKVMLKAK